MWLCRRVGKVKLAERIRSDVLRRMEAPHGREEETFCMGLTLYRNCLLQRIIEKKWKEKMVEEETGSGMLTDVNI